MKEIIELLTAMLGLLTATFTFYKLYSNYFTNNKKTSLTNMDIESYTFLPNDLKEFYKEKQKRDLFYTHTDIDASSNEQKLISKLSLKLNYKFSSSKLKIASQYFKYNENDISINIKKTDRYLANFFMVFSIILFLSGFTTIFLNLLSLFYHTETIKLFIATFSIGIISIILGVHLISRYIAPLNIAQSIDKRLKKIETQENV